MELVWWRRRRRAARNLILVYSSLLFFPLYTKINFPLFWGWVGVGMGSLPSFSRYPSGLEFLSARGPREDSAREAKMEWKAHHAAAGAARTQTERQRERRDKNASLHDRNLSRSHKHWICIAQTAKPCTVITYYVLLSFEQTQRALWTKKLLN